MAFLVRAPDRADRSAFSALEANGSGERRFLLAAHEPETKRTSIDTVPGSAEGRSFAYAESLGYVLGTSFVPQVLTYDPATDAIRLVFRGPKYTVWIPRLAGFKGWSVESWDWWRGADYLLLSNRRGELVKHRIDLETLHRVIDLPSANEDEDTARFLASSCASTSSTPPHPHWHRSTTIRQRPVFTFATLPVTLGP